MFRVMNKRLTLYDGAEEYESCVRCEEIAIESSSKSIVLSQFRQRSRRSLLQIEGRVIKKCPLVLSGSDKYFSIDFNQKI